MARTPFGNPQLAVAILRVSTDDQHLGPLAQAAALDAWAARTGVTIVAVFLDKGVSGVTPPELRTGLQGALTAIRETGAGVLVASSRCRLARDMYVARDVERAAEAAGARVLTADGMSDAPADEPNGILNRGMSDMVSAHYRATVRQNTRRALAAKKAKGERIGALPFGMQLAEGHTAKRPLPLVAKDAEQSTLAAVTELHAKGLSVRAIAAELASRGVVGRTGRPLSHTQVHRLVARQAA